jgi:ubiquinone/menaquinone biosynthesis C-methylase UbiE
LNSSAHEIQREEREAVNRAFSKQSSQYDHEDISNPILQAMRQQTYAHLQRFLDPKSSILELNAGTGIDALHFARVGHHVHATDIASGMIKQIESKIAAENLGALVSCQQLSYDELQRIDEQKFDYVFSNFGGLNCIKDLSSVAAHLPGLLRLGGHVTWVIMPPVYLWELMWFFKGYGMKAFRRLRQDGVLAHVEGEYINTFYHSLPTIKRAIGPKFKLVESEGLHAVLPPPSRGDFPAKHPGIYKFLQRVDALVRSRYPFNRCADHIIVTFKRVS